MTDTLPRTVASLAALGIFGLLAVGSLDEDLVQDLEAGAASDDGSAAGVELAPIPGWNPIRYCEDIANLSQCYESDKADLDEDECLIAVSYKARPTEGRCPTEGAVGRCRLAEGGVLYYYDRGDDAYDADKAREWCTDVKEGTPL